MQAVTAILQGYSTLHFALHMHTHVRRAWNAWGLGTPLDKPTYRSEMLAD